MKQGIETPQIETLRRGGGVFRLKGHMLGMLFELLEFRKRKKNTS